MRPIKFRAWDGEDMYVPTIQDSDADTDINEFFESCDKITVMQYTGLKDKNGKEIYEGDVVAVPTWPFDPSNGDDPLTFLPVTFDYGYFMIGEYGIWEHDLTSEVEVIGNIYENPELLTK